MLSKRQIVTNGEWGTFRNLGGAFHASPKALSVGGTLYLFESSKGAGYVRASRRSVPDGGPETPSSDQGWPSFWKRLD